MKGALKKEKGGVERVVRKEERTLRKGRGEVEENERGSAEVVEEIASY